MKALTTLDIRPVTDKLIFHIIARKTQKSEAGFISTQRAGGLRNETHHSVITTVINFTDRTNGCHQRSSPTTIQLLVSWIRLLQL